MIRTLSTYARPLMRPPHQSKTRVASWSVRLVRHGGIDLQRQHLLWNPPVILEILPVAHVRTEAYDEQTERLEVALEEAVLCCRDV